MKTSLLGVSALLGNNILANPLLNITEKGMQYRFEPAAGGMRLSEDRRAL